MTNAVFITGAATGIGHATREALTRRGYRVFVGVLPAQHADVVAGSSEVVVPIDVTDAASVAAAVAMVEDAVGQGGLRALVNNAGVANLGSGPVAGCSLEETETLFDINVLGTLRVTQAFLPLLHRVDDARIVNLSSGAVDVPVPFSATYNMSKAAVDALTRTLRLELAPFGIQVTSIRPGAVRTPMTDSAERNIRGVWDRMPAWVQRVYRPALEPANRALVASIERANPPERIASAIVDALESRAMRPHYLVGHEVRFLPLVKSVLSETQLERLLLGQLGLRRGSRKTAFEETRERVDSKGGAARRSHA